MKQFTAVGLATVAGLVSAPWAQAADMPVRRAPPPVEPAAVVYNWSGCYVGSYNGVGFGGRSRWTDRGSAASAAVGAGYNDALNHSFTVDQHASYVSSYNAGCNWQSPSSPFVWGAELEGGFLHIKRTGVDPTSGAGDTLVTTRIGNFDVLATGRLGYAVDRVLFYAKAGGGWVGEKATVVDVCAGNNTPAAPCGPLTVNASNSRATFTWVAGGGLEYAWWGNYTLKAEYMYLGLNRNLVVSGVASNGQLYSWNDRLSGVHEVRVGVNYKFN